jgi:hypothetical protein
MLTGQSVKHKSTLYRTNHIQHHYQILRTYFSCTNFKITLTTVYWKLKLVLNLFIFHFYSTFKKVTPSAMKKWSYIITWVVSLDRDNLEAFKEIWTVYAMKINFLFINDAQCISEQVFWTLMCANTLDWSIIIKSKACQIKNLEHCRMATFEGYNFYIKLLA